MCPSLQATPLSATASSGEGPDGYRMVGSGSSRTPPRGMESVRRKTVSTLCMFANRQLLVLAPTIVVAGLSGSFAVAAFHQVGKIPAVFSCFAVQKK